MKLKAVHETRRRRRQTIKFPNGLEFDSALSNTPFMSAEDAAKIITAYHYSDRPNLEQTGIKTRSDLGLPDLFKSGLDSTHQDSVYLTIDPRHQQVTQPFLYRIDLKNLDRNKFKIDEDAIGHSTGITDESEWIESIMCMGSFRYKGSIPAAAVNRVK